jgi:hypothetical protein
MGPRAGLDNVKKRKMLLLPVLELRSFAIQPVIIPTALSLLLAYRRVRKISYKILVGISDRKRVLGEA